MWLVCLMFLNRVEICLVQLFLTFFGNDSKILKCFKILLGIIMRLKLALYRGFFCTFAMACRLRNTGFGFGKEKMVMTKIEQFYRQILQVFSFLFNIQLF
jgi:hypothetical protein